MCRHGVLPCYKSSLRNGGNFCGTENIISLVSAVSRRIVGGGRFCLSARCECICQLNRSWLGEKGRVSIQLSEECSCRVLSTVNSLNSAGTRAELRKGKDPACGVEYC